MKNSTLIQLLKSLSIEEFAKFDDFIASPYFNKAVYVRNYFEKIKEFYPDFNNFEERKEKIFRELYPERGYNDATFRKLNSELLKLAEEFIIVTALKEEETQKNHLLLKELDKRKIDNLFLKRLEASYALVEKDYSKNENYYKEQLSLNDTEFLYYSMRNREKGFPTYHNSIENLDKYYIINKLRKIIVVIGENSHSSSQKKVEEEKKDIENFIKLIPKNKFFDFPVIQILYNILMIYWKGEKEYFHTLKELVETHKSDVFSELEWIYFAMLNYCIIQGNMGKREFAKEELLLYRNFIKDNLLIYNNSIESIFFKNIVSCAAEAGDIIFAEEFKEKYSCYLDTTDKADILAYCDAIVSFAKKDYPKALELLSKINFTNVNLKFGLRCLTLKIFYENEMYEQALFNIDSFQQNLKREKTIPSGIMKLYATFVALYKKLLKMRLSTDKSESRILYNLIINSDTIAKTWLLAQCEALS